MIIYNAGTYYKCKHIINDNFFMISHVRVHKICIQFFISNHFKGLYLILGMYLYKRSFKVFSLIKDQVPFQNINLSIVNKNLIISGFNCLFKVLYLIIKLYIVMVFFFSRTILFKSHLLIQIYLQQYHD